MKQFLLCIAMLMCMIFLYFMVEALENHTDETPINNEALGSTANPVLYNK